MYLLRETFLINYLYSYGEHFLIYICILCLILIFIMFLFLKVCDSNYFEFMDYQFLSGAEVVVAELKIWICLSVCLFLPLELNRLFYLSKTIYICMYMYISWSNTSLVFSFTDQLVCPAGPDQFEASLSFHDLLITLSNLTFSLFLSWYIDI